LFDKYKKNNAIANNSLSDVAVHRNNTRYVRKTHIFFIIKASRLIAKE